MEHELSIRQIETKLILLRSRLRKARLYHCGECAKWMNYPACPQETRKGVRRLGPHMNASICSHFEVDGLHLKFIDSLKDEIKDLELNLIIKDL